MQPTFVSLDSIEALHLEAPSTEIEAPSEFDPGYIPPDPRWSKLDDQCAQYVAHRFKNDLDEATYQALRLVGMFAHPPTWATQLLSSSAKP